MTHEIIAYRIRTARIDKKLSQRALAEKTGLSVTTICHIEQGKNADLATIDKIEKALGVELY